MNEKAMWHGPERLDSFSGKHRNVDKHRESQYSEQSQISNKEKKENKNENLIKYEDDLHSIVSKEADSISKPEENETSTAFVEVENLTDKFDHLCLIQNMVEKTEEEKSLRKNSSRDSFEELKKAFAIDDFTEPEKTAKTDPVLLQEKISRPKLRKGEDYYPEVIPKLPFVPVPRDFSKNQDEFLLIPEMIEQDPRSTICIKNIPNKYTKELMVETIRQNFADSYDFFYMPIDPETGSNCGYAFINFYRRSTILPFYHCFHGKKWEYFCSEKVCELRYARIQGKSTLELHFSSHYPKLSFQGSYLKQPVRLSARRK